MTITVSMPVYNTPADLLDRAVDSVLSQTFKDIQLVIVNDGGASLKLKNKDSRIVVYEMSENRGRYFADAAVLNACSSDFFTIHDSDDTSAHNRFEHMMRANDGVNKPIIAETGWINPSNAQAVLKKHRSNPTMQHFWFISSIYRTKFIKGLIHPGFRVGYDTILCSITPLFGEVTISHPLLYKRYRRQGSLTTSSQTGTGSPFRQREIQKLLQLFSKLKTQNTLDEAKQIVYKNISEHLLEELSFHSVRLQNKMIS